MRSLLLINNNYSEINKKLLDSAEPNGYIPAPPLVSASDSRVKYETHPVPAYSWGGCRFDPRAENAPVSAPARSDTRRLSALTGKIDISKFLFRKQQHTVSLPLSSFS
jgi:hypothetical protein